MRVGMSQLFPPKKSQLLFWEFPPNILKIIHMQEDAKLFLVFCTESDTPLHYVLALTKQQVFTPTMHKLQAHTKS